MGKLKGQGAVAKALKQSNQDTTCNTFIDDTVKFVSGHTKRLWKSAVEIASLTQEDLNISRADR